MSQILYGFDLDDTLILTDHQADAQDLYLKINNIRFNPKMYNYFCFVRERYPDQIFILTSRPFVCKDQIEQIFQIKKIYTNSQGFQSHEEITRYFQHKDTSSITSVQQKMKVLTQLQQNGNIIIYFDDIVKHFAEYNSNENILVIAPFT